MILRALIACTVVLLSSPAFAVHAGLELKDMPTSSLVVDSVERRMAHAYGSVLIA